MDNTITENLFTNPENDDTPITMEELMEELGMNIQSRYHDTYSIYLYCTVEEATARQMMETDDLSNIPLSHIVLYETPEISKAMAVNIIKPRTLKVAVNQWLDAKEYHYDQLIMSDEIIKERYKVKDIEDYKSKCVYTRELVTEPKSKLEVIQYKINTTTRLKNPQYV